jgi:hypothetical protein
VPAFGRTSGPAQAGHYGYVTSSQFTGTSGLLHTACCPPSAEVFANWLNFLIASPDLMSWPMTCGGAGMLTLAMCSGVSITRCGG